MTWFMVAKSGGPTKTQLRKSEQKALNIISTNQQASINSPLRETRNYINKPIQIIFVLNPMPIKLDLRCQK